jgi:prevent-host-death family protein
VDQFSGRWEVIRMARTLPISEVKTHLPALLTGVEEREEEIIVTRKGRPAAVLVNFAEYERLKATVDVLGDPGLMRQIRRSRRYFAGGGKGLSLDEVLSEPPRQARRR